MKRFFDRVLLLLLIGTVAEPAHSADLRASFDLQSAKVLPAHVRNLRYKSARIEGNDKFNNGGQKSILADPLFQQISWRDITDPQSDEIDKGLLRGYLEAEGFDLGKNVGRTTGAVSVSVQAHIPVLAYGVGQRLTTGVAVPILRYSYHVNTSYEATEEASRLVRSLERTGRRYERAEFLKKMRDPIGTKLKLFGDEPLQNEEGSKLGDLNWVTKYNLQQNDWMATAVQMTVVLPTGEPANINKAIDVAGGDDQWDVGATLINDYESGIEGWSFASAVGAVWQFNDHVPRRVPYRQDSKLTPFIDPNVARNLGDLYSAQLSTKYQSNWGPNAGIGYTLQYKERDRYAGTLYSGPRYQWMEVDTEQNMQNVQVGLGYSTVDLFKRKQFPIPIEANATYSAVVRGKNVARDPLWAFELVMFF